MGVNPERHLIASYETDPRQWLKMDWIDQYSGEQYRITTAGHHGSQLPVQHKRVDRALTAFSTPPVAVVSPTLLTIVRTH
jgi:hypothetical protein